MVLGMRSIHRPKYWSSVCILELPYNTFNIPGYGVGYEKYKQTQRLEQCMYPGAPFNFIDKAQKHNFVRYDYYSTYPFDEYLSKSDKLLKKIFCYKQNNHEVEKSTKSANVDNLCSLQLLLFCIFYVTIVECHVFFFHFSTILLRENLEDLTTFYYM